MNINQLTTAILAKKFRYFLLAFLITSHLFSQEIKGLKTFDPSFEHFQLPGGAMGNSIQGIVQDSVGYMWFASQAGLHRYDGRNFITFNTDPNNPNTLISDYIEDIYLDSKGMIWLSHWTGGGLTSYDPDNAIFKRYISDSSDPESILPNETSEIIEDAEGYIWVGGSGGLSRLDPETGKFKRFYSDPENPNTLSDEQVRGLYVDKENTLWVATGMQWQEDTLGGLNRYIPETESFERFIHDPDNPSSITNNKVRSMFEDSKGNFWIGTGGDGLHTLDKQTGTFTHYPYDPNNPGKISKPVLNNPQETINPEFSHITSIYEDRTGRLWITSAYTGLNVYDPELETTFHFESGAGENDLKTNFIWQTFQSDDETIWIATGGEGQEVYKLKEKKLDFPFYETISITGDITSESHGIIKDDNGKIWMGLSNEGPNDTDRSSLLKIDRTTMDIEQIRLGDLNDDSLGWFKGFMGSLTKDQKGNIWVGTDKGYFYGDTETADFKSYRPDYAPLDYFGIPQILSRRNGEIWIANWESGVIRYQPETGDYELFEHDPENPESLFGPIVMSMFEDSKGNIWLGGGSPWYNPEMLLFLDRFNPVTGTFEHFIDETITNGSISDITEDAEGNIWFIDLQDGLYKLNPVNKDLRKFTPFNSLLPNEYFHTIFTHPNGNIWINGDHSLIELDPVWETMSVYNELHGIKPAQNFWNSGSLAEDGEILFARTGGFHAFNPDDFFSGIKNNLPDLRITGFRLLDDHISSGMTISKGVLEAPIWRTSQIELENTENVFSFSVACFDFYDPEANQIQFMLEGYDRGWREDIRNGETPYYVNVRPGEYIFRLRGANSMGVWNKEGISLKIIINPPWYITWWAYVLYGLIFIAGIVGFDRFQRNRLLKREREKTQMRELAQAKEIEKAYTELKATQTQLIQSEKMASLGELTAGIAHEIQNPLNFVNNFSEVNKELISELREEIANKNFEDADQIAKDIEANEDKILRHGKRADAIVKGMLQHSRTSSGQKEPTDINALADEYLRLAYHGLRAKDKSFNANFKTEFDKSLPKINVIPQDIGRVLLNLINNAFYAVSEARSPKPEVGSKDYKPEVTVSTKKSADKIEISVKDNGSGIPDSVKDKIFQPFFTTKPTGSGTGLGLSMSYDIVKAHGGEIKVESILGEGTEFTIQIPVA